MSLICTGVFLWLTHQNLDYPENIWCNVRNWRGHCPPPWLCACTKTCFQNVQKCVFLGVILQTFPGGMPPDLPPKVDLWHNTIVTKVWPPRKFSAHVILLIAYCFFSSLHFINNFLLFLYCVKHFCDHTKFPQKLDPLLCAHRHALSSVIFPHNVLCLFFYFLTLLYFISNCCCCLTLVNNK